MNFTQKAYEFLVKKTDKHPKLLNLYKSAFEIVDILYESV